MKTQAVCPACKFPIPLWRIMIAPTPYSIKCPICLSTIRLRMGCVTGILLAVSAAVILIALGTLLVVKDLFQAAITILIIILVLWVVFEFAFGLLVCNTPSLLLPLKLGNEINPKFRFKGK